MFSAGTIAGLFSAMGYPEIAGIAIILLVILGARFVPGIWRAIRQHLHDFNEATRQMKQELKEESEDDRSGDTPPRLSIQDHLVLWLAEGLGSGLAPVAPGTFGSLVGVAWFIVLVWTGDYALYLAGTLLGIAACIPLCGAAERILKQHDPSSVVLDEIVAVPVCFLPWVTIAWQKLEAMPPVGQFFTAGAWQITLGIFVLFRAFDALKPWPISRIQNLPGGWGVTADDLLAAIVVALLSLFAVGG